jgi:nucleoside-diphosphate-sugar epimerase
LATYLVTGCAGFIGARITEMLLAKNYHVVGIDNLDPAYDIRLKDWRLTRFRDHPHCMVHLMDVRHAEALEKIAETNFDAIIHLAARAGVRSSVQDPKVYYETNLLGTLNLLELGRMSGTKKFVLASTSSLYGAHNPLPFREDANTDAPLSPYAASKKAAETLCYSYHHLHGLDITVLRYFTVYGPAGRPDMSIFRFIQHMFEGRTIEIYGSGDQARSFTYVDDIARGTISALPLGGFTIINLGHDRVTTVNEVIQTITKLTNIHARIAYRPPHPADVAVTQADITKARERLAWSPQIPLEEGLQATIEWYRQNRVWAKEI